MRTTSPERNARVVYAPAEAAFAGFDEWLRNAIRAQRPPRVCEIGGGAHPSLTLAESAALGFRYTVLDISAEQLAQAPDGLDKVVCDIAARDVRLEPGYDLMFSRMLAEHVADGEQFHRNVFALLNPGGIALHFMPTLPALPFVLNRLMPEWLADAVWRRNRVRDRGRFPARYQWCRGPTPRMIRRFESLGFEVVEFHGFFGHGYYHRLPPLHALQRWLGGVLARHPRPTLTSYAWLMLRKPLRHDGTRA